MADTVTNEAKRLMLASGLAGADLRVGLLGGTALTTTEHNAIRDVNNVAAMEALANVAELTGASGYVRQTLAGETAAEDDTNDWATLTATTPVNFGALGAGATIVGAFVFVHTGSDATATLVSVHDISPTVPTNGGTFSLNLPNGIIRVT